MILNFEYTKQGDYSDLQRICDKVAERDLCTIFSMFDEVEGVEMTDDKWLVKFPNIESTEPLVSGKVTMINNSRHSAVENPTWKDILLFFDMTHDGHHVYLEALDFDEDARVLEFSSGS